MNLVHANFIARGMTLEQARAGYEGCCIDAAGSFIDTTGIGRLAYFETPFNLKWRYHAAVEIDGMIHDLWGDEPLPLTEYMQQIGATEVDYPAESPAQ
jgi:hypothetical protein